MPQTMTYTTADLRAAMFAQRIDAADQALYPTFDAAIDEYVDDLDDAEEARAEYARGKAILEVARVVLAREHHVGGAIQPDLARFAALPGRVAPVVAWPAGTWAGTEERHVAVTLVTREQGS